MCDHHGPFDGDLICTRDDHADNGHTYQSTSGDVPGQQKSDGGGDDER